MALNQRKPIDLLSTPAVVEFVENHLTRLKYGVYTWLRCRRTSDERDLTP